MPGVPGAVPPPNPNPAAGLDDLGASLEGQVRVIGDKPTNSLIVMSSGRDFIAIKDVMRRLDQPRRQMFIEALILEVQLSKDLEIGTSSHGGLPVDNGERAGARRRPDPEPALESARRPSLAAADRPDRRPRSARRCPTRRHFLGTSIPSYGVLFQALATQNNTNMLSAPQRHRDRQREGRVLGRQQHPVQGRPVVRRLRPADRGAPGDRSPTGSIGQNIQRQDLNLTLNVTPHISSQRRGPARDRAGDQGHRRLGPRARPDLDASAS